MQYKTSTDIPTLWDYVWRQNMKIICFINYKGVKCLVTALKSMNEIIFRERGRDHVYQHDVDTYEIFKGWCEMFELEFIDPADYCGKEE